MIWTKSSSEPECLVFVDEIPRSGQENMDLDSQILDHVCENADSPILCRLYRWSEPTITLGYFQDLNAPVPDSVTHCPQVKRLTGGGAILHDCEWTYSLAVPTSHSIRHDPLRLYEVVHQVILDALAEQGIECCMRQNSPEFKDPSSPVAREDEPFLCFLRQDDRDIVSGVDKVVGSAQRRRKGNILQHGSVLIQASNLLPEMPGLKDLHSGFDVDRFVDRFAVQLGEALSDRSKVEKTDLDSFLRESGERP